MKIITRWWWIVAAGAALAQTLMAAKAGEPGGPGEYRDFKVLKSYFAKEGEHIFRAFVIEWTVHGRSVPIRARTPRS